MWEALERIEEGEGKEMEWEMSQWKLVKGNGGDLKGKRKRGKKLRWTPEALGYARLKEIVGRRFVKAGRRLEGEAKRKRLDMARRKRGETLQRLEKRKEKLKLSQLKKDTWWLLFYRRTY